MKRINWKNIFKLMLVLYVVASIIGLLTSKSYIKKNGNECKGYKWAIHVCSGDINVE